MNNYKFTTQFVRCYYPPRSFYIRKNPRNIEWKIINHSFSSLTSSSAYIAVYSKFFCDPFSLHALRDSLDIDIHLYSLETIRLALRSLCLKNICTKHTRDERGSYPALYQFKNPIEYDLCDNIEKTAFKF